VRGDSLGLSHIELDKLSSDVSETIDELLEVAGEVDILQSRKPDTTVSAAEWNNEEEILQ